MRIIVVKGFRFIRQLNTELIKKQINCENLSCFENNIWQKKIFPFMIYSIQTVNNFCEKLFFEV